MLRSLLIGVIAGMRSMVPLAVVSDAARRGALPQDNGAPELLGHPLVAAGTVAMTAGELLGDKLPSAPDRVILPGLAARVVTGAVAGAALAPRSQRNAAAVVGAVTALGAAFVSFALRMRAMRDHGQTPTGLIEDTIAVGGSLLLVHGWRDDRES